MNTPAHLVLGAAVMARPATRRLIWVGMLGGLLPDLSLYLLAGVSLFLLNIPPQRVFNELYFSDLWQGIFAVDNSFVIWGALLALALWFHRRWAVVLCGAALLHLTLDFPLHHDDGRPHFWPLSNWVFESPLSYWDRHHGARWIAPLEAGMVSIAVVSLWMRRPGVVLGLFLGALLLAELYIVRTWLFTFLDS